MVIRGVFRHVPRQLGDLYFVRQVPLETGEQDLPLRRLETIQNARYGPAQVVVREVNQILVDKVAVAYTRTRGIQDILSTIVFQPSLSIATLILAEGEVETSVRRRIPHVLDQLHVFEVPFRFAGSAGAEPLVVLDLPRLQPVLPGLPILVVGHVVKAPGDLVAHVSRFDDRSEQRRDEAPASQQRFPV